jgi:hypothetical protein
MTTSRERPGLPPHTSGTRERFVVLAAFAAIFVVFLLVMSVAGAGAAPVFNVDDTTDAVDAAPGDGKCESTNDGSCTLRAAVMEAGAAGGDIVLPAGTFKLTIPGGTEVGEQFLANQPDAAKGDLDISKSINVKGAGPEKTVIDGQGAMRIFDVHNKDGVLGLEALRLTRGKGDFDQASGHYHGGAVHNHGYANLFHVVVDNSISPPTGAGTTYCDQQFTPQGCLPWGGGGITNAPEGVAGLTEVTVARNGTDYRGGGIENIGRLSLKQTTIAENRAPAGKGGGLSNTAGTVTPSHTLIAQNSGNDCWKESGAITSAGYNLQGDATCGFTEPTDHTGGASFEPELPGAPLYYAISSTSAAEDTGGEGANHCSGTDIRGVTRPQDSDGDSIVECDIGSYEKEAPGAAQAATLNVSSAKATEGGVATAAALRPPGGRKPRPAGLRFTVTLSQAAKKLVTVRAATADRSARAGADYRRKSAKLRFAPGQTKKSFLVKVLADKRAERTETLKVKLSAATNATIARALATGTIVNR